MDHLVCISTNVVDLGAITPFFVVFRAREEIYDLLDSVCGASDRELRPAAWPRTPDDFDARCKDLE
jgi:NADH:ubiquinone oxidoreductase subunit D